MEMPDHKRRRMVSLVQDKVSHGSAPVANRLGRALQEMGIAWIAARSPQAKGRVERNFGTAQDRLVKSMRVAGVKTLEQASQYLEETYLVWWERELTVERTPSGGQRIA